MQPLYDEDELTKELDAADAPTPDPTRQAFYQDLMKRANDRMNAARASQVYAPTREDYQALDEGSRRRAFGELLTKSAAMVGSTGGKVADTSALSGFNKAIDDTARRDLGSKEALAQRAKTDEEAAVKDVLNIKNAQGGQSVLDRMVTLDDGVYLVNPVTKAKVKIGNAPRKDPGDGPSAGAKYADSQTSELRKEWNAAQTTKDTYGVLTSYEKLKGATTRRQPDGRLSPSDEMSLIFGFMKMQDPGSTVREGEYASAQNTRGVDDTVRNVYNSLLKGQRLTKEQVDNFMATAKGIAKSQLKQQTQIDNRYRRLAKQQGVNPALVLDDEFDNLRTIYDQDDAPTPPPGQNPSMVPIVHDAPPSRVKPVSATAPSATPTGPRIGQKATQNGIEYTWNGQDWE